MAEKVLCFVGFVRKSAPIGGPSPRETDLFARKVSRFFQVVATLPRTTNVLDLAASNPLKCREDFRNEWPQVWHAIGWSINNHDAKRKNGDVVLVFEFPVHRHESLGDAACALQQITVLGPRQPRPCTVDMEWATKAAIRSCGRFSSSSTRTCQQGLACKIECRDGLFASNGRKLPEKLVQGIASLNVVQKVAHGNSCAGKDRGST